MRTPFLFLGLTLPALPVVATVVPAAIFQNGAVIQRALPWNVWGTAAAGERVRVRFLEQQVETRANPDGTWKVTLRPESVRREGAELQIAGENLCRFTDVVVGDVWLCAGQSNMELTVAEAQEAAAEIAGGNYPLIRQIKIPHLIAEAPASDLPGTWEAASPATVGRFTAVGYFFARDLHQRTGVPIGIINCSWGATQIESWMSADALRQDPSAVAIDARWRQLLAEYPAKLADYREKHAAWLKASEHRATAKRASPQPPDGPGSRWQPSGIYNAMVAPLHPFALRGVLWYQGETNSGRPAEYSTLFHGLIRQWRADFQQPRLPFYFVQIANFSKPADATGKQWAFLREAQATALALPATGMAVTIDIGDAKRIHPKNKQEVGRRLALLARAHLLAETLEISGPVFQTQQRRGGNLHLSFAHAEGLQIRASASSEFEVAGEDRRFVPARVTVAGTTLIVSAAGVPEPVAVRYAWRNAPEASLFNSAGLPAAPFRSDAW